MDTTSNSTPAASSNDPSVANPSPGQDTPSSDPNSAPANELLNRVVQGAHQTIDRLAETAAPHVQRLQEGVNSAGDALHTRADEARHTGEAWAETLRCSVRENPLLAIATALAVGMLISRLTRD